MQIDVLIKGKIEFSMLDEPLHIGNITYVCTIKNYYYLYMHILNVRKIIHLSPASEPPKLQINKKYSLWKIKKLKSLIKKDVQINKQQTYKHNKISNQKRQQLTLSEHH